jgi:pilus assembly protein CpaE
MVSLAILSPVAVTASAIEQMAPETGVFHVVLKESPQLPAGDLLRSLRIHDPEVVLLDLGDWDTVSNLATRMATAGLRAVVIGFRPQWNRLEQATFEDAGIRDLLREPFSIAELEAASYEALHRKHPVTNPNILAFLPAKAGSGCSTVVLHTAGALAHTLDKRVVLLECDRRSGVLSILLNLENRSGIAEALQHASDLTNLEWHQHYQVSFGVHLLLANPARRGPLPSWADYHQLLRFLQNQYEFLLADLPEVVNQATAEVVKSARAIFIVCTPEVPSLRLAAQRSAEIEACEIPPDRVYFVLNRWERGGLSLQDVEKTLGRPVFITLPNDYARIRQGILESRLASEDSAFSEGCRNFARKLSGLPATTPERSRLAVLKRLARIGG